MWGTRAQPPQSFHVPLEGCGGFGTVLPFAIPGGGTLPSLAQTRAELGSSPSTSQEETSLREGSMGMGTMIIATSGKLSLGRTAEIPRHSNRESHRNRLWAEAGVGQCPGGGQTAKRRWVLAVLFLQLHVPQSLCSEDREQQGTGIATPDKLPVVAGGWIQTPAWDNTVNYKINPPPSSLCNKKSS